MDKEANKNKLGKNFRLRASTATSSIYKFNTMGKGRPKSSEFQHYVAMEIVWPSKRNRLVELLKIRNKIDKESTNDNFKHRSMQCYPINEIVRMKININLTSWWSIKRNFLGELLKCWLGYLNKESLC